MLGRDTKKFRCTGRFEAQLYRRGWHLVAGCDEAGRGALIGPVYAAAVILNSTRRIRGVDDSKKLTPEVRAELEAEIRAQGVAVQVAAVPADAWDALKLYKCARL